jgi:uncharacterized protein YvpB
MKMKVCKKCLLDKELNEFNKRLGTKDGLAYECRECSKKRGKEYYNTNQKKIKNYQKEYYQNNNDYVLNRIKNYREKNFDKINESEKKRRKIRKTYLNEYNKKRREVDVLFRLITNLRSRTYKFLKNKSKPTKDIIGINLDELKKYLESKFYGDICWENYGLWHIDHIVPLSTAKNEDELIKLCHYTNLQPLYAKENIIKSNKI